ncbi:MAG: hypothetical protein IKS29_00250 [Oscillospiraceae bacterium]|nr:hypothetical protein [Oscillospiraceae bacterium]
MKPRDLPLWGALVLAALAAFGCIFLCLGSVVWTRSLGFGLLLFLPALVLGVLALVRSRISEKLSFRLGLVLLLLGLLLQIVGGFVLLFFLGFTDETEDPRFYRRALRRSSYAASELANLDVFPDSVPEHAQDVAFHFQPAVLQGGEELYLTCTLPQEAVQALEKRLEPISREIVPAGPQNTWEPRILQWFSQSGPWTRYRLTEPGESGRNHGTSLCVYLCPSTNQVIWTYDRW